MSIKAEASQSRTFCVLAFGEHRRSLLYLPQARGVIEAQSGQGPGQGADQGWVVHALDTARAEGLPAIPGQVAAPLIHVFKHGVLVGLSEVPKVTGPKQRPCRDLLECPRDRHDDVLRFTTDLRLPPTSIQADRDLRPAETQQKISGGSAPRKPPGTGTQSAATSPPPPGTGPAPSSRCGDALLGQPWMPPIPEPP